jgi:hypothetical protein
LIASEFVSTVLGLILVYIFVRTYRLLRSSYLLGLPVGFSFLAASYVLLGFFLILERSEAGADFLLWLRLIMQTYGFAFIAFSYHFSMKTERATKHYLAVISLVSVVSVLFVLGALVVSPPFLEFPNAYITDEFFRVANLVFLAYTVYRVVKQVALSSKVMSGLLWAPLAFSIYWVGQYSLLIWGLDGSQTAFVGAHIARLVALVLLIYVFYSSGRS